MSGRRTAEVDLVYGKVIASLSHAIHHALCISCVYPKELFTLVPYGAFAYHRSRHPELNAYIERQCNSVKRLLVSNSLDRIGIQIMDGSALLAEWSFEFSLSSPSSFQPSMLADWMGSIITKMCPLSKHFHTASNPSDRTFAIVARLKNGMNMYRFGGDTDWVLADTPAESSCMLIPVKAFFTETMKVKIHNMWHYCTFS